MGTTSLSKRTGAVDRRRKINGQVSKVDNLKVNPAIMHPDYKSEPCDGIRSETGKLEILKVVPKSGGGPSFIARWDQKPAHLDIDMHGASPSAIRKFKNNKGGYSGHHTSRTADPDKRLFDINIQTPLGTIFDGTVSFSNAYGVMAAIEQGSAVTVHTRVIRAGSKTEGT
jgi:hypothetical protein